MSNASQPLPAYRRPPYDALHRRVAGKRLFLQVVAGPRQVGKTTIVRQVLADLDRPAHYATADDPGLRDASWLTAQWEVGRVLANRGAAALALDEIQKVRGWSEVVKRLWDEDSAAGKELHVILLGSSPSAIDQGLTESLTGRFEVIHLPHWSFGEMRQAFGWDLEMFIRFGGYPGAAPLIDDFERWRSYMLDSLIETTLSRDVMLLTRIDKPALLRQLFRLGIDYSGQALSYQKLQGQLQDAGNTVTLAHYLRLLEAVGLLAGLERYSGSAVRQRGSSPKLVALDPGLITAMTANEAGESMLEWGRVVESAVGAHLINTADRSVGVHWWREGDLEVDYVVTRGDEVIAVEVGSGTQPKDASGLRRFQSRYPTSRLLLVGAQGLPLEEVLSAPAASLFG